MSKSAVFRADANARIGTGHVLRCRILALKLQKLGFKITFICKALPEKFAESLESNQITLIQYPEKQKEKDILQDFYNTHVQSDDKTILIIDHDAAELHDLELQARIRNKYRWALMYFSFDDQFEFDADIVLNQNVKALGMNYKGASHSEFLLGPQYVILSDEYAMLQKGQLKRFEEKGESCLLFFGGADVRHQTLRYLKVLAQDPTLFQSLIVVCGALNPDLEDIKQFLAEHHALSTELHINTPRMPELMANAKYALSSGGLTLWELACLNTLQIVSPSSERESKTVEFCADQNLLHEVKDVDLMEDQELIQRIKACKNDPSNPLKVEKFNKLVAVDGAMKVSEQINNLMLDS
jgi:UDP-2,4-diacetamido-2,4,6-trideoxy-beta-L-altropyranose hydrolase